MKAVITASVILPLFFGSCKPNNPIPSPVYHITKSVYYNEKGVITDSAKFTYDGPKLRKVDVFGDKKYYCTFQYNGGLISKKNIFYTFPSTTADEYTKITYSGNNISLIEHYIKRRSNYIKYEVYTFTYNGTQLSKIVVAYSKNGTLNNSTQYDYTYSNNNVVTVKSTDFYNNNATETITYTYDNNKNYYNKMFAQSLIADPMNDKIDEGTIPFIVSTNNAISLTIMGETFPIAYVLDSSKNLLKVTTNTKQAATYEYSKY